MEFLPECQNCSWLVLFSLLWIDNLSASYCTRYSMGIVSLFLTAAFEVGFFFWFCYTAGGILPP